MKLLFLSYANSQEDKKAWSGTMYKVFNTLEKLEDYDNVIIDFLSCNVSYNMAERIIRKYYKFLQNRNISNKQWLHDFTFRRRNEIASHLLKYDLAKYDYIFVLASSVIASALHKALLIKNCCTPYIYLADATFSAIENYYPEFSNLHNEISRQANQISKEAFMFSYKSIVSSDWAKQHAIKDYNISGKSIEVIEFGANLDYPLLGKISKSYKEKKLSVLFCGVHWIRKGGNVAVECCNKLIEFGFTIELNIVGMTIPREYQHLKYIKAHGFLDKNDPEQYNRLIDLMLSSDILLFPSKAECSAITLCEASGFGLPIFCYDTGGLSNYVINGKNGYRLPLSSSGNSFAEQIKECFERSELSFLSEGAAKMYNEILNWNHWKQIATERIFKE